MVNKKFQWYWKRLQAMSPDEMVARVELALKKRNWRRRLLWVAPEPNFCWKDIWLFSPLALEANEEGSALLIEADSYLRGEYKLLNLSFYEVEIDWHLDPQVGKHAPLTFGIDLDYRDTNLVGNVKNIWEKNRHHHLTVLAVAYTLTTDERYAQAIEKQLFSWVEDNPFPLGVNWQSSLELGIRLISWVWIERLLRGSSAHINLFGEEGVLWNAIYWHQWLIAQHYSHGSSANNHLVGEMAGLFIAASVWPFFPDSAEWQALAQRILEREVSRQTFPSGLNREQAFSYHIFSLEFFLLAGLEGERLAVPFSPIYQEWVRRMLEVIPLLVDVGGNLLRYGDGDEGMALQLRSLESSRLDWLLRLGCRWPGAQIPLPKNNLGLLAANLIWPNTEENELGELKRIQGSVGLHDAGIFVMTSKRGCPRELFCVADAGPLGYLSIAAHGHADALSFTLSVGGIPVLIDPGTYVYHADPLWRSYFRGTKAHNTVVVDDSDQSVAGGIFLWVRKSKSKVLRWEERLDGGLLVAEHDGYTRLPGRVIHQRKLDLQGRRLEINDELRGDGVHTLECRFHFSPVCTVSLHSLLCQVSWNGGQLSISLDPQMQWVLAKGEKEAGWYSPGFNIKEPTHTLVGSSRKTLPISLINSLDVFYED